MGLSVNPEKDSGRAAQVDGRKSCGWGLYHMALMLESSVREWYTTKFKVDLNQGVVR